MTVEELACRFPEVSADLCDEPLLAQFAETFGTFLQEAENPGACSGAYSPGNHFYIKLMGPIRLHMYGLCAKEKTLGKLQELLDQYSADAQGFVDSLSSDASAV
jgi:hypothetical protein